MIYDLIIIGGGPGGISAGIYACRQGLKTLLITKEFGGQMVKKSTEVCNYPGFDRISGTELIKAFTNHVKTLGIAIDFSEVKKISKVDEKFEVLASKKFTSHSVILATGAVPRMLKVSGEDKFVGRGVSYCVTCDGPLFRDKEIVVAGGGNAGFEAAIFMAQYASKIYILEFSDNIRADKDNQEVVKRTKKIKVITGAEIKEITGNNFVNGVKYIESGKEKVLNVQGIFIEIGSNPATEIIGLDKLAEMNAKKEVVVNPSDYSTRTPGLYAVGDASNGKWKQIVTAAGEGCKAALSASDYIYNLKLLK